jgi:hypothetical protein
MKNTFKYLAITLIAVLGLSFAACSDGGEEGSGAALTINGAQVYKTEIDYENLEIVYVPFDGTVAGLNYIYVPDATGESGQYLPLASVFDGANTASLVNGKLSLSLGTPKASALTSVGVIKDSAPDLTISAADAKLFLFAQITDSGQNQSVYCNEIIYMYVNKNVKITGTEVDEENGFTTTLVYALDLKTGWNVVIQNIAQTGENTAAGTVKTGSPTGNEKWLYMDSDY